MELTRDDIRVRLSAAVRDLGSQKALADRAGVSQAYVCDVLKGRREAGERLLAVIDMRRVERFVFISGSQS